VTPDNGSAKQPKETFTPIMRGVSDVKSLAAQQKDYSMIGNDLTRRRSHLPQHRAAILPEHPEQTSGEGVTHQLLRRRRTWRTCQGLAAPMIGYPSVWPQLPIPGQSTIGQLVHMAMQVHKDLGQVSLQAPLELVHKDLGQVPLQAPLELVHKDLGQVVVVVVQLLVHKDLPAATLPALVQLLVQPQEPAALQLAFELAFELALELEPLLA
jgi:hypothetical protein